MNEEELKYLQQILDSITLIELRVGRIKRFDAFTNDTDMKDAINMRLTLIGEAVKNLERLHPNINITHIRRISGLRNRIVHAYDAIEDSSIWAILINEIPLLRKEIETLFNQPNEK